MKATPTLKLGSIALLTVAVAVLAVGTGAAALSTGDVTLTDPANETVTVDADFSGSADVTLSLSQDGTEVQSETISGASGDSKTASMPMQGLSTGDYNLTVSATDESVVTLSDPTMQTTRSAVLNVTQNETVAVDVLFDTDTTTSATVNISDSSGVLNTSTLTFDPVETAGTTGTETVEWDATTDGQLDVTVTTNAYAYDGIAVTQDSGILGGVGAGFIGDAPDIPPWASAVGGIVVMAVVAALIVRLN